MNDASFLASFDLIDDFFFISLTIPLLYLLLYRYNRQLAESEQSQQESEERFRSIFELAAVGVALVEPRTGKFVRVNSKYCDITGYSADELQNKRFQDITHADDRQTDLDNTAQLLRGEIGAYSREKRYLHRNGSIVWVNLTVSPQWVHGQNPSFKIVVVEDITDRKRVEEKQIATIKLLRLCNEAESTQELMHSLTSFFQQVSACEAVGIRIQDEDDFPYFESRGFSGDFIQAENSLCDLDQSGELVRDCSGNPVLDCMCGNIIRGRFDPSKPFFTTHGSFWSSCTTELLASSSEADRQSRTRNRCNGEGYESVALIPIRFRGETSGLFQFNDKRRGCFDVEKIVQLEELVDYVAVALAKLRSDEALQRSEQSLLISEERFRSFFELSLDPVLLTEPDGIIVEANSAACNTFGMTLQEMRRVGRAGIMDHNDPRLAQALEERMRNGWIETELTCIRKNGEKFQAEVSSVVVQGDLKRTFVIIRDITERKQAQDALRDYARRLIELEEDLRKEIAAELHDEIGCDLTVLGMNLALISDSLQEAPQQSLNSRVQDSGRLVEGISRNVRSIMSNLRPPVLDDFGLLAALRWHAEIFSMRTGIEVSVQADETFPRIALDKETSLFRISQEALMNAAKHADTQIVKIKLRKAGGMIRLEVADEGNGFNPALSALARAGTGWGMKIMRERTELIGGELRLDSAPGKGTVVSVNLPLEEM